MIISDLKINSNVRAVLCRHWVDLQKLNYASFKGAVRLQGELAYLGTRVVGCDLALLEFIEQEIRRIDGVKRVNLDIENIRKSKTGKWEMGAKTGTIQYNAV